MLQVFLFQENIGFCWSHGVNIAGFWPVLTTICIIVRGRSGVHLPPPPPPPPPAPTVELVPPAGGGRWPVQKHRMTLNMAAQCRRNCQKYSAFGEEAASRDKVLVYRQVANATYTSHDAINAKNSANLVQSRKRRWERAVLREKNRREGKTANSLRLATDFAVLIGLIKFIYEKVKMTNVHGEWMEGLVNQNWYQFLNAILEWNVQLCPRGFFYISL